MSELFDLMEIKSQPGSFLHTKLALAVRWHQLKQTVKVEVVSDVKKLKRRILYGKN
jgi:hypothetical protein